MCFWMSLCFGVAVLACCFVLLPARTYAPSMWLFPVRALEYLRGIGVSQALCFPLGGVCSMGHVSGAGGAPPVLCSFLCVCVFRFVSLLAALPSWVGCVCVCVLCVLCFCCVPVPLFSSTG